ncbi:glycosyltransferase family 4 protein [soil metagenome]
MRIAFVYSEGRLSRDQEDTPSEFFYGYRELKRLGLDAQIVETGPEVTNLWTRAYNLLLNSVTPARTNGSSLYQAYAMLDHLQTFDCVVATYAQSALGLGFWKNLGRLRPALVGIQCGLVNYPLPTLRRRATAWFLHRQTTALFASTELPEMARRFDLPPQRLHSCDFGVDLSYWQMSSQPRQDRILAVGNDGRRDYETLLAAAISTGAPTRLVTKKILPEPLPANVELLRGDWHQQALTDAGLRAEYQSALCVVVPLSETLQPSGQSVAMQAMACGTPVIMSRTGGYWGEGWLEDGRDIILVPPGDPAALAAAIQRLRQDPSLASEIGSRARAALVRQGGIESFAANLLQLCRQAVDAQSRSVV